MASRINFDQLLRAVGTEGQTVFSSDSINIVSEETVCSCEGRTEYLRFLQSNETVHPIHKLFGSTTRTDKDQREIEQQFRKLARRIHPDKNPGEEQLCEELFKRVEEAKNAALVIRSGGDKMFLGYPPSFETTDPVINLRSLLKEEKWGAAKKIVDEVKTDICKTNPSLSLMSTIVFFRLNLWDEAIACVSDDFTEIKQVIDDYKQTMRFIKDTVSSATDKKDKLLQLIETIDNLIKTFIRNHPDVDHIDNLNQFFISHVIYVALSEQTSDLLIQERYLRIAIRKCPDSLSDEKQALINDLKAKICRYSEGVRSNLNPLLEFSFFGNIVLKQMIAKAHQFGMDYQDDFKLKRLLQDYDSNKNPYVLETILEKLETIKKPVESSWWSPYRPIQYSEETKLWADLLMNKLRGLQRCLEEAPQEEIYETAHYFLTGKEDACLGIVQYQLHEYDKAIRSLGKYLESSCDVGIEVKKRVSECIFKIINMHDTTFVHEKSSFQCVRRRLNALELTNLDSIQCRVLNEMQNYLNP